MVVVLLLRHGKASHHVSHATADVSNARPTDPAHVHLDAGACSAVGPYPNTILTL
jgi:hypothetical protein